MAYALRDRNNLSKNFRFSNYCDVNSCKIMKELPNNTKELVNNPVTKALVQYEVKKLDKEKYEPTEDDWEQVLDILFGKEQKIPPLFSNVPVTFKVNRIKKE
jgi:hypothetical protein